MKFVVLCCVLMGCVASSSAAVEIKIEPQALLNQELAKLTKYVDAQLKDPKSVLSQTIAAVQKAVTDWAKLPKAEKDKVLAEISKAAKGAWDWLVAQAADLSKQLNDPTSPLRKLLDEILKKAIEWLKSPAAKKIFDGIKGSVESFFQSPIGKHLLEEGSKLLAKGLEFFNSPEGKKLIAEGGKALAALAGKAPVVAVD